MNLWVEKDSFMTNNENIKFKQLYPESNIKISEKLHVIIILLTFIGLIFNKYGRYYLLVSFILSYVLIIFKL